MSKTYNVSLTEEEMKILIRVLRSSIVLLDMGASSSEERFSRLKFVRRLENIKDGGSG